MVEQGRLPFEEETEKHRAAAPRRLTAERPSSAATRMYLHYSNRTEKLLEALIANLETARSRPGASPLDPATIVVPNRQIETYLKFGIARSRGIASNIQTPFLRHFLGEVIELCRPDARIVAGHRLRGLLLTSPVRSEGARRPGSRVASRLPARGGRGPGCVRAARLAALRPGRAPFRGIRLLASRDARGVGGRTLRARNRGRRRRLGSVAARDLDQALAARRTRRAVVARIRRDVADRAEGVRETPAGEPRRFFPARSTSSDFLRGPGLPRDLRRASPAPRTCTSTR